MPSRLSGLEAWLPVPGAEPYFGMDRTPCFLPCQQCGWDLSLGFLELGGRPCCCQYECDPIDYDKDQILDEDGELVLPTNLCTATY